MNTKLLVTFVVALIGLNAATVDAQTARDVSEPRGLFIATLLGSTLAAGATVGLTVGGGLAWCEATACEAEDFGPLAVAIGVGTGYVLGAAPFTALGTWRAGRWAGGRGRYDLTLLGSTVGTGVGIGAAIGLTEVFGDSALPFTLAAVPVLQIAGSMLGYHLSHLVASSSTRRAQEGLEQDFTIKWAPVVSADAQGGMLGVAGSF